MCKTEIFARILNAVAKEVEMSPAVILSSKSTEAVDARYIVTELCSRHGMYPIAIAERLGLTPRAVNHILSTFSDRIASHKMMQINYEAVKNTIF